MRPRLLIEGLRKSFDGTTAVRDIDLALAPGEFLSLLGPSGCGKSTTLAMIAGFIAPDAGRIVVDGRVVNDVPPQRRRIGLVFQDYAVFTRLSVRGNLLFGLEAQHVPQRERISRLNAIAERLDLVSLLQRHGASLNMSEMQRVALARVLVTNPELLLLDEPMSNLDAAVRATLRGELKRIQKDLGQSVLYVTHDQAEAMSMSDRIAIMSEGVLLQVGTPDEIYNRPVNRFVAEFIGDPPINLLKCQLISGDDGSIVARTAVQPAINLGRGRLAPGEYLLAIRPHDITLSDRSDGSSGTVRFIENLGAEIVVHVQFGGELVALVTEPGRVSIDDAIKVAVEPQRAHLIETHGGLVVSLDRQAMAA